jgi:hypothetical protein
MRESVQIRSLPPQGARKGRPYNTRRLLWCQLNREHTSNHRQKKSIDAITKEYHWPADSVALVLLLSVIFVLNQFVPVL